MNLTSITLCVRPIPLHTSVQSFHARCDARLKCADMPRVFHLIESINLTLPSSGWGGCEYTRHPDSVMPLSRSEGRSPSPSPFLYEPLAALRLSEECPALSARPAGVQRTEGPPLVYSPLRLCSWHPRPPELNQVARKHLLFSLQALVLTLFSICFVLVETN